MINAGINNGDLVLIRPTATVENGEIALVVVNDSSTIKRFYKRGDQITLAPENAAHTPQIYDKSDHIRVLGRFIKVIEIAAD